MRETPTKVDTEMQVESAPLSSSRVTIDARAVSVVIPVHNGARYLRETLQSVMDQTARAAEVIVVDDGSTDDTAEIARAFDVRVISQAKRGPAAARNTGTRSAIGEFVAYLDADDLWTVDKLAVQCAALSASPEPSFSFTDFRVFDERGPVTRNRGLRSHPTFRRTVGSTRGRERVHIAAAHEPVLRDNYILPSSLLVRRAHVLQAGGFDESIRIGLEDYEFFLRLFRIVPAIVVMRPLLLYRRHDSQLTSKTIAIKGGFFEIQRRVAASPDRYPPADVRYIANSGWLQHYRIGMEHARIGQFDQASFCFGQSISARSTLQARLALGATRVCQGTVGQAVFGTVRTLWKRRPRRR